jgi:protein-L-isoaspartate(D-aspartate) O-methyltransferase
MEKYAVERRQMVAEQLARRGLADPRLIAAFDETPRHLFVPDSVRHLAYGDGPLPIGFEQTISQPYIVALMTDLLHLSGSERVLDVGTGSGYQAAILARMADEVHSVELVPELAERAARLLDKLGMKNVDVHVGDGSLGWPEAAPYAGIVVAAAAPRAPQALLDQLADGGRLVIPVGQQGFQRLEVWRRSGDDFDRQEIIGVAFVPLLGEQGWSEVD